MSKNFIERFNQENIKSRFWDLNKKIYAGLAVLLLAVVMVTGCTSNKVDELTDIEIPEEEIIKEDVKIGNDGVNAAIAPDDTEIIAKRSSSTGSMVTVSVEDLGRSDPFLPSNQVVASVSNEHAVASIDLLPPPESITVDSTAVEVVSTKVSGIMFDRFNPSAILNIGGSDYLVRTGDVINNYKVLSIGKENVTVQNGANVYKAGVGELFTGDGINYNTVSNLESKFGGNKNSANKR